MTIYKPIRSIQRFFPITRFGCILLTLTALTTWTQGIAHQDLVLLAGAAVLLAIQTLLLLTVIVCAAIAWRRTRHASSTAPTLELETGVESTTGFAITFPNWLPFVTLTWKWTAPIGVDVRAKRQQRSRFIEDVVPDSRALAPSIEREFTVRDFLGLSAISWTLTSPVPLRILPARLSAPGLAAPLSLGTGDDLPDPYGAPIGDQVEMREYQPGDSPRLVRWKLYARTGKLFVRMPERAIADQPSACAWLCGGRSTNASAQLARELLERGSFGSEFLFGADGSLRTSQGDLDLARDLIAASANVPTPGALGTFLQTASSSGFSDCVVFAGPGAPPDLNGGCPLPVRIVICVDELSTTGPAPLWKKILFHGEEHPTLDSIRATYAKVAARCELQIFEHRSTSFFAL